MEFSDKDHEHVAGSTFSLYMKMTTFLPEEGEEVMFTSCTDVPYEIKLSDEENFEVINRSSKLNKQIPLRDAGNVNLSWGRTSFNSQFIFRQDQSCWSQQLCFFYASC